MLRRTSASGWTEKAIERERTGTAVGLRFERGSQSWQWITSLSAHDDTSEVSDLRARIEQQLIAAVGETERRSSFGELFEHHGKKVFGVVHWMMRSHGDREETLTELE